MKQIVQTVLLIGVLLAAGCVTRYQTCYPGGDERTVFAIATLYDDTRVLTATNGVQRYQLAPDAQLVASAEALLLHYSRSADSEVRSAAACRLAHFGTRAALSRALELAHAEQTPDIRAGIWSAIAELLQSPLTWPLPQIKLIAGSSAVTAETNLVRVLSSPDLRVVIICWHKPADFILPPDFPIETIDSEIVSQYASDTGTWPVTIADRIPFVPFSTRRRTVTLSVRQSIADALQWTAQGNKHILAAFQDFSRDQNEAISAPAREVVEALSHTGNPRSAESREDRTSP